MIGCSICHSIKTVFLAANAGYAPVNPVEIDDDARSETTMIGSEITLMEGGNIPPPNFLSTGIGSQSALINKVLIVGSGIIFNVCFFVLIPTPLLISSPILMGLGITFSLSTYMAMFLLPERNEEQLPHALA